MGIKETMREIDMLVVEGLREPKDPTITYNVPSTTEAPATSGYIAPMTDEPCTPLLHEPQGQVCPTCGRCPTCGHSPDQYRWPWNYTIIC